MGREMVYGVRKVHIRKEELVKAAVSEGLFPEIATIDDRSDRRVGTCWMIM
jgi:hypothetical protein